MVERQTPEREVDPHSGRRVVSLSKIHLPPKKYWQYPGSGGSVPTGLKNCSLGRYAKKKRKKRTTCISQGFWPPLKPNIKSDFTTLSLDCFIR